MNDIEITGPTEKIETLFNRMVEENSVLEVMTPIGEWDYNKAIEHWGTKWDAEPVGLSLENVDENTSSISGAMDTAWGPPIQAFKSYAEQNEDVDIYVKYYEPGMCFVGEFAYEEDNYYEYDPDDLSSLDEIPEDLVEHFNLREELDVEELVEF